MKIELDLAADAAYVRLSAGRPVRQVQLDDGRVIDYGADDAPVGVELLSPSRGVNLTGLPRAREIERALRERGIPIVGAAAP